MLSVNWFWKKCRLARFSERIPLWQSPPRRDGCLVFVTFPTNLHTCDKKTGVGQRVDGTRVFWETRTFGGRARAGGPAPHVQPWKVKPSPPLFFKDSTLCSPRFECMSPFFPLFWSMSPLFPLFWKYESFVTLVLKVWGIIPPCIESISPLFPSFWKY